MNSRQPEHDADDRAAAVTQDETRARARDDPNETIVPVLAERLEVGTRRVEVDAGVRVTKTVDEREETVEEPLVHETVDVERVAVNRSVDGPVAVRYEGDTMVVPVLEEVLYLEKRLVLKEEIRITRRRQAYRAQQQVVLRSERASVERIEGESDAPGSEVHGPDTWTGTDDAPQSIVDERQRHIDEVRRRLR